ncbi:hypothetical protein ANASTE_01815 [Anaerofustis stercorihominis DSM 17244]|uniref:Uncharacterized protein n=1 Tax=Anaerofustis stercorihominis DSM 17244 TaxID=445971 RepID=B1C9P2_9FIRM|nr:hypothetical protein ANASTE_01815 [Anaerofustis stercorihominis DSM 17244]
MNIFNFFKIMPTTIVKKIGNVAFKLKIKLSIYVSPSGKILPYKKYKDNKVCLYNLKNRKDVV